MYFVTILNWLNNIHKFVQNNYIINGKGTHIVEFPASSCIILLKENRNGILLACLRVVGMTQL